MAANGADEDREQPLPPDGRAPRERAGFSARAAGRVLARIGRFAARWLLRLALPLVCAAAVLQAFPYHATVQGVPFEVQGTLLHRTTLSADTTLGSWEFPDFVGLPVGIHITPEDVDVLRLTRLADGDMPAFVARLQADITDQVPAIARWLIGELLVGLGVGLAIAAAVNMSLAYLRRSVRRPDELRHRLRQLGAAVAVTVVVGIVGVVTYNPDWVRESRLTGTLAAAQLFPDQLSAYYSQQNKAFDVLGSVVGIQAALQAQIEDSAPEPVLQVMVISDMHLAANYGLVGQYATSYGVDLIVDVGDEAEFGTAGELTPAYLDALRAVTATTPMLWVGGNHDSPAVEEVMRGVPGVTVLGAKIGTNEGYAVAAGVVSAYGLTIAGLPDPRVYGGPGAYGSEDAAVTDPLERRWVREAVGTTRTDDRESAGGTGATGPIAGEATLPEPTLGEPTLTEPGLDPPGLPGAGTAIGTATASGTAADGVPGVGPVDVFAVHEPVQADELRKVLPGQIRETVSGHVHEQNASDEIQDGTEIDLVEGSTGAGGLDNIVRGTARPPIEFSIESVGADCQFTRVVRFSIEPAEPSAGVLTAPATTDTSSPQAYGNDVTASTVYFRPQEVAGGRTCGTQLGIGAPRPWPR